MAFHFGLFQFLMPVIGWLAGQQLSHYIHEYDHWVALGLLTFVGLKMLWQASAEKQLNSRVDFASIAMLDAQFFDGKQLNSKGDPTRGLTLVLLSLATSIDALAVGVSMALLGVSIWLPSVVIGVVTASVSAVGITFGGSIGARWGRWADIAGGIVLILIGVKIFVSHFGG